MHHSATHSTHDIRGTIRDEEKTYQIDMHTEEKDSRESENSTAKYTSRFVILTNTGTALITAGISAGVTIAVAYSTCGK